MQCPRCGRLLVEDLVELEWACILGGCGRRWEPISIDPGPPVRLGPPIEGPRVVIEHPPDTESAVVNRSRCSVPGLRDARTRQRMRQEDLARELGVTKVAVCHWESGRRTISASVAIRLASILEVRLTDLTEVQRGS